MKKVYLFLFFIMAALYSFASHIYGGEMIYEYLGGDQYRITLKLFRDNLGGGAQLPSSVYIGIFDYGTKASVLSNPSGYLDVKVEPGYPQQVVTNKSPCIIGDISADYSVAIYSTVVSLPDKPQGYICSYETCCRVNGLANVYHPGSNPGGTDGTGSTYVCRIPGSSQLPADEHNSSPKFVTSLDLVCYNKPFKWDFSATDPDGDSLVYSFAPAYNKTVATDSRNVKPASPSAGGADYPLLSYINGYISSQPLGGQASIDPKTGIISGIAPDLGKYVVCVIIKEYRKGKEIAEHRKDFILRVQDCDLAAAKLKPSYSSCDDFNYTFHNEAPSTPLFHNFYWEFGDGSSSTTEIPTHQYASANDYAIKLVVNRGEACSDSTSAVIHVWPGFFPGFSNAGVCVNKVTQFRDTTKTVYGFVNSWNWDFGDAASPSNISLLQNPQHTYNSTGTKSVKFIVSSNKGCVDTVYKDVNIISKPVITLGFKDTLICNGDKLPLNAGGSGAFSWTPTATIVSGANTPTPVVSPPVTTKYIVTLNDDGCINNDSVRVRVVNEVTLAMPADSTICLTDGVRLIPVSDALQFVWTPAATLSRADILSPVATPLATTTYVLKAVIGGCSKTGDVDIKAVPYPGANAGKDTLICYATSAQLSASIRGSSFVWSPTASLSDASILNPVASPAGTTAYILTVRDNIGCPKPGRDTVIVKVLPKMRPFAGRDTAVVEGQPLQFNGSGGIQYTWTPPTGLNDPNIVNPVGIYDGSFDAIRYQLLVKDDNNCTDLAYINVKVFSTQPQVFVPDAFTPNGDGKNDVFRPIAVGLSRINYFRVFNRWGQLVFTTTVNGQGWDGKINGREQGSGTYAWVVQGVDYKGKIFFAKGTATLIR